MGMQIEQQTTLFNMAVIQRYVGNLTDAEQLLVQALALTPTTEDPYTKRVQEELDQIRLRIAASIDRDSGSADD
jgi:hypothetical protein